MANNLQNHERRDKSKWFVTLIAFILAFVAIAAAFIGIFSDGFTNWDKFKTDEEQQDEQLPEEEQTDDTADGVAVIGESQGNGVSLLSAAIATADYEEYGISPMAETAYQLTATITPSDAYNKAVDWSVEWVNPSSSWASGKTVTDYVTVTPTSDGALTANVENIKAFGEQIKVVCTSRDNPEASAECLVDYAKRITGVTVKLSSGGNNISVNSTSKEVTVPTTFSALHYAGITSTTGVGTVSDSFTYSVKIKGSSTVANKIITESGGAIVSAKEIDFTSSDVTLSSDYIFNHLYTIVSGAGNLSVAADVIARESVNSPFAYITVNAVGEYSSYSCELALNAAAGVLTVSVSSVAVNEDSLTF